MERATVISKWPWSEAVVGVLKPLQDRFANLARTKNIWIKVIKENAEKASYFSIRPLERSKKKWASRNASARNR